MKNGLNLLICCIVIIGFNNCSYVGHICKSGNGNVVEQERKLAGFTALEVSGAIEVNISQGDTQKLVVITDANLQENVKTEVESNHTLMAMHRTLTS